MAVDEHSRFKGACLAISQDRDFDRRGVSIGFMKCESNASLELMLIGFQMTCDVVNRFIGSVSELGLPSVNCDVGLGECGVRFKVGSQQIP